MTTVASPLRVEWAEDMKTLVTLEGEPRLTNEASEISLDEVMVLPSLFQPRGESLGFNPWASQRHVEELASAVSDGRKLDPIALVAFGPRWVLVDGHHRREAYIAAGWTKPVPAQVFDSPKAGEHRATWAVALSASLNAKDKLPMSPRDKADAAWRLVVLADLEMSKRELVESTTVRDRTIGNMRSARNKLLGAGWTDERLYDLSWAQARLELARLDGDLPEIDPELYDKQLRRLMKKLTKVVDGRTSAMMLLDALERLRPGLELELETAIQMAKERRRVSELLDI